MTRARTFTPATVLKLIALARLAAAPEPLRVAGEEVERFKYWIAAYRKFGAVNWDDNDVEAAERVLALLEPSAGGGETDPVNDPKYAFRDNRVWNRADGKPIPDDEPVFVLRARDLHAVATLNYYAHIVQNEAHSDVVFERQRQFAAFAAFAKVNPHRMKEPDTAVSPTPDQPKPKVKTDDLEQRP